MKNTMAFKLTGKGTASVDRALDRHDGASESKGTGVLAAAGVLDATDQALLHLLRLQPYHGNVNNHEMLPMLAAEQWQELAARSSQLGVAPLIFDALRHLGTQEGIPSDVLHSLRGQSNASTIYNLLLYQQLHELLKALHARGIDVMLLKGAFFAKIVYRSVGLRTMSDLDLMVHEADLERVYPLLAELDFEPGCEALADNEIMNPRESAYHNWFSHKTKNLKVEVHWLAEEPDRSVTIDVNAWWARASTSEMFGMPVFLLSPEDTLVHQCVHISYHHVFQHYGLRGLCDIKHLIEFYGEELDWQRVCAFAKASNAQRSVYLSLLLAQRLLHAQIPTFVFDSLHVSPMDGSIYLSALERVLGKVDHNEKPRVSGVARLHLSRSWKERLQALTALCFPSKRQIAAQFQVSPKSPRLWLAYVQRWGKAGHLVISAVKGLQQPRVQKEEAGPVEQIPHGRTALILWLHENG